MQLHFAATGNFRPLQTSLRSINQQVNRSMAQMGQATASAVSPLNQMGQQMHTTGRINNELRKTLTRNARSIIAESKAIGNAQTRVYRDMAGNAKVFMDINRNLRTNVANVAERFRFMNTVLHGVGRNMIAVGKNMQWAGRQVTVGLTVPLGLAAVAARKAALEYNEQFTRILKVNNEASQAAMESAETFDLVSQSIRRQSDRLVEVGASMGFVSSETSAMVAELSQMGYAGVALDQLSEAAMRLSRTAGTDLTTSLELSRLSAQAFNVPLDELTMTFARLNLIENNTALSLDEMAKAMPVVAGVAATMGMEIAEVSGLMAMMKENGIGANEGATALRTGLLRIVQEATDPAIEAFEGIGLNLVEMQDRMNSLTSEGGGGGDVMFFFDELSEKLREIEARGGDAAQIGLNQFAAAISKMVGVRSSARFLSFLKEVGDRTDENTTAGRAWIGVLTEAEEAMRVFEFEERMVAESAAGVAKRLKAELNVELVKLGENFLDVANKMTAFAVSIIRAFNSLDDRVKNVTLGALGLVAALGPTTMMAGIMTNAFGQVLTILTKLLPKYNLVTVQTRAQEVAYNKAAVAAGTEATAQHGLAAARLSAAGAASVATEAANRQAQANLAAASVVRAPTMLTPAGTPGRRGPRPAAMERARAGFGRGNTTLRGSAGRLARRNAAARSIAAGSGSTVRGSGAALQGAVSFYAFRSKVAEFIKGMFTSLGKAVKGVAPKIVPGGIKSLMSSLAGAVGTAGKALAGSGIVKGLGVAGAALGPALAPVAIVGAAAAVAAMILDFESFKRGFSEMMAGPIQGLKNAVREVGERFESLRELVRQLKDGEGGLSSAAEVIGTIAGWVGGVIVDALTWIVGALDPIFTIFEGIAHTVDFIGNMLSGDWPAAMASITEVGKAIARVFFEIISWIADGIGKIVSWIPGLDGVGSSIEDWAEGLTDFDTLASDIDTTVTQISRSLRENVGAQEDLNDQIAEGEQFYQELIDAEIWSGRLTEENIWKNERLTDEMRRQLLLLIRRGEIQARLNELTTVMERTETRRGENSHQMEVRQHSAIRESARLVEEMQNLESSVNDEIAMRTQLQSEVVDGQEDFTEAVEDTTAATEDLEDQLEAIRDKIRESEEAAKAWASALKSSVGDVINDIADATMAALEAQEEQMNAQFEEREEAIESAADAELERIEAVEEAEQELEEQRKRWFEQQRARIEYLKGMEQENVRMGEMVARGDLAEASVIRIGLQRDAEAYMLDSYEREADKYKATKRDELEDKRAAVEETKRLALEQLEVEIATAQRAYEARRRGIELYLADWKRTIPATEAEFRSHLAALTTNMRGFGINLAGIATHYTDIAGHNIFSGFTSAIAQAEHALAQDAKWEQLGRNTGAAYRAGLVAEAGKIEGILDDIRKGVNVEESGPSAVRGATTTGSYTGPSSSGGWTPSTYRAYRGLSVGSTDRVTSDYPSGVNPFGNLGATQTRNIGSGGGGGGSIFRVRHDGGGIDGRPNMPGLKSDESAYVLQHGEYVVQRDAVEALGLDYMERINQAKRHDGGLIDYSQNNLREAGAGKSLAGYAFGRLATLAAADIVQGMGGDPSIKSKDKKTRGAKEAGKIAGLQIAEVAKAFGAQQGGFGSAAGWAGQVGPHGWPPRRWAQISPNTHAAQRFFQAQGGFPGGIGAGVHRGVQKSDHSWGKALDFMVAPLGRYARGEQKQRGWQVANWHMQNPNAFGTKYVIWDKMINSGDARGWRNYTRYGSNPGATLGHYDHVHVSYKHDGGLVGLRKGGKIRFDDTTARLHKGETVIDAAGTRAMENAVKVLTENAGGGGNVYELNIRVEGGNMDEKRLAKAVMREIETAEVKHGRKRVLKG